MTSEENNNTEFNNEAEVLERETSASKAGRHPMEVLLKSGVVLSFPRAGDLVEGAVIDKKGARLFVDLGGMGVGVVYGREFSIAQDLIKGLNSGDSVSAKIVELDNEEGYVELSLKEAGEEKRWVDLKKMMQEGEAIELPVLEANRGGLILEVKGVKGFLPASQLSSKNYPRVEGGDKEKVYLELQKLVGTPLKVKILDLDPRENKVIFTEKETDRENIRAALAQFKVGDEVEGEITGVVDFGAFMRLGSEPNIEGLIHISEIDWTLIEDPRGVLKPGDKVKAKIIDIQGDKISLSLKALKEDPWVKVAEKYKKGDVIRGKVTKFNPFGAFVELESQVQGLV
ncbi:MAG: S1 RNA-binding domain-containing protein, partial [Candidatus Sungbacteria bacterium]|nr:S1 RNA-binding domain-containing protein [Candidatus Sungbacteria bacterium]